MNNVKYDVSDMPKPGLLVGPVSYTHLYVLMLVILAIVLIPVMYSYQLSRKNR